jgi:hypothetical protein
MATNRNLVRRPYRGQLNHWQEMELWLGPSHQGSAFSSEDERRAAWLRNRDKLMAAWAKHGKRPDGWWSYESPIPRPREGTEQSSLFEAGLLTESESSELLADWHEQFERAYRPDFFHCDGPGRFFNGAVARRKHFEWADIPKRLIRQWTEERRWRSRKLERLKAPRT